MALYFLQTPKNTANMTSPALWDTGRVGKVSLIFLNPFLPLLQPLLAISGD